MHRKIKVKNYPTFGDKKKIAKFAWLPFTTSNGYRIWLEHYISHLEYKEYFGRTEVKTRF